MYKLQNLSNSTISHHANNNFWQSILLLLKKPHLTNKRLTGTNIIELYKCSPLSTKDLEEFLIQINKLQFKEKLLPEIIETITLNEINSDINETFAKFFGKNESGDCIIVVSKLIPKNLKIHSPYYELCFLGIYQNFLLYYYLPTL